MESTTSESSFSLPKYITAKKTSCEIFTEILRCLEDCISYSEDLYVSARTHELKDYWNKVKVIYDILKRNKIKIVFIGRTSTGKSSTINALLHKNLLPVGVGHTTKQFFQISDDSEEREGSDGQECVWLSKIRCPKEESSILQEGVILIDSPAFNQTVDYNKLINIHCADADIFVLMVNAVSGLDMSEKDIFVNILKNAVCGKNIFVLNNFSDLVESDKTEDLNEIYINLMNPSIDLLVDKLKVATREETIKRIFFISSKEVLLARLNNQSDGKVSQGFESRYADFVKFEQEVDSFLSEFVLKTKFEQLAESGLQILNYVQQIMNSFYKTAKREKKSCIKQKEFKSVEVNTMKKVLSNFKKEMIPTMSELVDDVKKTVIKSLQRECTVTEKIVDNFKEECRENQSEIYFKSLLSHIGQEHEKRNTQSLVTGTLLSVVSKSCLQPPVKGNQKSVFEEVLREFCQNLMHEILWNLTQTFENIMRESCSTEFLNDPLLDTIPGMIGIAMASLPFRCSSVLGLASSVTLSLGLTLFRKSRKESVNEKIKEAIKRIQKTAQEHFESQEFISELKDKIETVLYKMCRLTDKEVELKSEEIENLNWKIEKYQLKEFKAEVLINKCDVLISKLKDYQQIVKLNGA